jgi:hypothetical protein
MSKNRSVTGCKGQINAVSQPSVLCTEYAVLSANANHPPPLSHPPLTYTPLTLRADTSQSTAASPKAGIRRSESRGWQ